MILSFKITVDNQFAKSDEYCILPKDCALAKLRDQVRIGVDSSNFALYTVLRKEGTCIRINNQNNRLDLTENSEPIGYVSAVAAASGMAEDEAKKEGELIERSIDHRAASDFLVIIAPHGGQIDVATDRQAEYVAAHVVDTSLWMAKGWKKGGPGSYKKWHITSNDISCNSFPQLAEISNRQLFDYCVAFHGLADGGILIGGAAPIQVRLEVKKAIEKELEYDEAVTVRLANHSDCCNGFSSRNVVNWLTKGGRGGIQIEQDRYCRKFHWKRIATGIINAFSSGNIRPLQQYIHGV